MKIGVNGKAFAGKEKGGAVRAAISLLRATAKAMPDDDFILFVPCAGASDVSLPTLPGNVSVEQCSSSFYNRGWARSMWEQFVLPRKIAQHKNISALLSLTNSAPVLCRHSLVQILLIHDVGFLNTAWFSWAYGWYLKAILWAVSLKGAYVTTVSKISAQQIEEAFPRFGPVSVIYNGVDTPPPGLAPLSAAHPYVLFLGSVNPRKNLEGAIAGFRLLKAQRPSDLSFVVAGAQKSIFVTTGQQESINLDEGLGQDDVTFKGYVSEAEKWALLRGAKVLVLPSFLEGFGLPILEAMQVGTPVVASNISVFRELFEDHVVYIDPHEPRDIAKGLQTILEDDVLRDDLRERGRALTKRFSWEQAGVAYAELLHGHGNKQVSAKRGEG